MIKNRLHGNEGREYAEKHLLQLHVDADNWIVLWINPLTNEFWHEHFPQSELHGGGPSEFVKITEAEARDKFGGW